MHPSRAVPALVAALLLAGCTSSAKPTPATPRTAPVTPSASAAVQLPAAYAAFAAGLSKPVKDPIYPKVGTDALDVLHYGLALDWSVGRKVLTGTATLQIRPVRDAATMSLDFKPYTLDSVKVDGSAVKAAVVKEKLVVQSPVKADQPVTLVVAYHGKPSQTPMPSKRGDAHPLGLTVDDTGGLWTMQEVYGAFTWYPVNDHPSDEATYDIAITVPKGWSGVASGTPAGRTGNTFKYHSADPVASYATTLAVGKYRQTTISGPHGIPIHLWYHADEAQYLPKMKKASSWLSWLEKRVGPYPFPSAGMVVVASDSAMETQQMVTIGISQLQRDAQGFDVNGFHETSHQWFGDSVTLRDWQDMWLNEGWALYMQGLYTREVWHTNKAEAIKLNRQYDALYRKQYGPPGHPHADEFGAPNVYTCASGMLRQLNQALGDDRFFAMARGWIQEHRNTTQSRASFTAYVNQSTGHDFTALINAWLDSPTTPPETKPL